MSRVLINCQLKNTTFEIVRCNDNIHQYWYYTLILKQKFYLAMYKIIDCSSITLSMIVLDPNQRHLCSDSTTNLTLDQAKEGWLDLILMIFTNVQAVDEDDSSLV